MGGGRLGARRRQRVEVVRIKNRHEILPPPPPARGAAAAPPLHEQLTAGGSWGLSSTSSWASWGTGQADDSAVDGGGGGVSGYRDVAVNLRVVRGAAAQRGLAAHVCEVQLLLEGFARVKSDDGHARYVEWRNCRGE